VNKLVNSVVLGLVSFVIILSVFWYVVEIRQDSQVSITDVGVRWGPVDARQTEVRVALYIQNPHKSPALVNEVSYEFTINGVRLREGTLNDTSKIDPSSNETHEFSVLFPTRWVIDWMDNHLENQEHSTMRIKGEVRMTIAQVQTVVPYQWDSSWEGAYVKALEGMLHNCPPKDAGLCVASTKASWDTSGPQSVLQTGFGLQNAGLHTLRVKYWTADLQFGTVAVAKGGSTENYELAPGGSLSVPAALVFERQQLPGWWTQHVARCEKSPTSVLIRYILEEDREGPHGPETVVSNVTWQFSGPTFDTRFLCTG
jgi:LEA14-like dessication related protein